MKKERSSWEEVIKILSSYNLIKNEEISYGSKKFEIPIVEYKVKDEKPEEIKEVEKKEEISIEDLKAKLRQELLDEIKLEKERIFQEAEAEIGEIRENVKKQAYKEGYKLGRQEGYDYGIASSEKEAARIKENSISYAKEMEDKINNYLEEEKEAIIDFAIDIAETIVNFSIDRDDENLFKLLEPIISNYEREERLIVSCNPISYDFIKSRLESLDPSPMETKFIVVKDGNLEKNDLRIESDYQLVDLSIRKQIESIRNTIRHME